LPWFWLSYSGGDREDVVVKAAYEAVYGFVYMLWTVDAPTFLINALIVTFV
jgi:hypothetical protein